MEGPHYREAGPIYCNHNLLVKTEIPTEKMKAFLAAITTMVKAFLLTLVKFTQLLN